jgi:hypothetical protein
MEESSFFLLRQSEMKWVVSSHSKQPLGDLLLSFQNLGKAQNFLTSRPISSSGMLSYYSSEATAKEDRANSKTDESGIGGVRIMVTNMSTSNQSFTRKRSIMIRTTFSRQFMILEFAK